MALFGPLRRLRKRAHDTPSPSTMAELAETYFKQGQADEAFRTLERAMAMYPDSDFLRNLTAHLRRVEFERQIRVLQRLVEERPNDPTAHLALAEIYFAMRDTNMVIEVVTEGLTHCPGEENLLLVGARARLERCSRDLSERDCLRAVEDLRQVLQDNPWDEHAQSWLTAAQAGPGPAESLVLEEAVTRVFKRGRFPIDLGGEREHPLVESLTERPMTRDVVLGSTERLKQALMLGEGLRAAVWAGLRGPEVLIRGEGLGEANVLALADVASAGERACLDMDLGRPERAVITGPAGTVVMVGFANGHLLTFFSPTLRSRDAERRVSDALREAGMAAEETSGA